MTVSVEGEADACQLGISHIPEHGGTIYLVEHILCIKNYQDPPYIFVVMFPEKFHFADAYLDEAPQT